MFQSQFCRKDDYRWVFAFQHAGPVAVFHFCYRPNLMSKLPMDQFNREQVPGNITIKSSGIPIDGSPKGSWYPCSPFKSCQSEAFRPLSNIVGSDTGFGMDGRRFELGVELDQPRPIDDHHSAHSIAADKHVRSAAQKDKRYIHLP